MKRFLIPLLVLMLLTRIPASAQDDGPRVIPPDLEPITVNNIFRLEPITTFGFGIVQSLNWSPDSRTLAINGESGVWMVTVDDPEYPRLLRDDEIEAWMEEVHERLGEADIEPYRDLTAAQLPYEVSLSHDRSRLAENTENYMIRVWDTQTRHIISVIPLPPVHYPTSMTFSADNSLLVAGVQHDDGTDLVVWDVSYGQEIAALRGVHNGVVLRIALNPAGTLIAAEDVNGTLTLWDYETGDLIATYRNHYYGSPSTAFSPDGSLLASGQGLSHTILWETATGRQVRFFRAKNAQPGELMFIDNETLFGTGMCGPLAGWNITTGEQIVELGCKASHKDGRTAINRDGRWIVGALEFSPVINVWDVATDTLITELTGHDEWVIATEFSPDGSLLASGSCDATIRLWDTETWEEKAVITRHEGCVWALEFSPDSRFLVSASGDGTARLWYVGERNWDTVTGTQLAILYTNQQQNGNFVFSPDGRMLVTSACQSFARSRAGCSLVFWDVASVQPVRVIQTDYPWITITFNPAGTLLAIGTPREGIELWGIPAP
jgi:WD40 repeat protein